MDTDDGQHLELLHAGSSDVSLLCISEGVIVSILLAIAHMRYRQRSSGHIVPLRASLQLAE